MAFTKIQICNNALVMLGHTTINSFTDSVPASDILDVRYPMARERCLTEYPWNFSIMKARLSQHADEPTSVYDHKYLLPSDCLTDGVLAAYDDENSKRQIFDYVSQGGYIMTDQDVVYVDYQADVDEGNWPVHFADFVAHAVAADVAYAITKKMDLADEMMKRTYGYPHQGVGGVFQRARVADAHHSPPNNKMVNFPLTMSRRSGVSPWRPST